MTAMTMATFPALAPAGADFDELTVMEVEELAWEPDRMNTQRAMHALVAVAAHGKEAGTWNKDSLLTAMGDLLCDLRHLADAAGIDFEREVADTADSHAEELNGLD